MPGPAQLPAASVGWDLASGQVASKDRLIRNMALALAASSCAAPFRERDRGAWRLVMQPCCRLCEKGPQSHAVQGLPTRPCRGPGRGPFDGCLSGLDARSLKRKFWGPHSPISQLPAARKQTFICTASPAGYGKGSCPVWGAQPTSLRGPNCWASVWAEVSDASLVSLYVVSGNRSSIARGLFSTSPRPPSAGDTTED